MFDIQRKDQIVVPFQTIGEESWEASTKELLERIADNWGDSLP
jgi:hypothetical protein